jgi:hypothetical protein
MAGVVRSPSAKRSSSSWSTSRPQPIGAIKVLLDLIREIEGQSEPASPETSAFSEADEKVLEQLRARFQKAKK